MKVHLPSSAKWCHSEKMAVYRGSAIPNLPHFGLRPPSLWIYRKGTCTVYKPYCLWYFVGVASIAKTQYNSSCMTTKQMMRNRKRICDQVGKGQREGNDWKGKQERKTSVCWRYLVYACSFKFIELYGKKANVVYVNFKETNTFLKDHTNRKEFVRLEDYTPDS